MEDKMETNCEDNEKRNIYLLTLLSSVVVPCR